MDVQSVMAELESLGTEQNIKVYKRHGAGDNVFGVSYANLKAMKKKIGVAHELAIELWNSGNSDARSLAMMLASAEELTPSVATQWMKDVTYPLHASEVAGVVSRSATGLSKMRQWRKQKSEFARTVGYSILTHILKDDSDAIEDFECTRILKEIEVEIHRSPNNARHAMVMAVIAIGIYKPEVSDEAIAAGERIGDVEVDHGETSCKTPAIVPYIQKALKRAAGKSRA